SSAERPASAALPLRIENAATRASDRCAQAWSTGDAAGLATLLPPGFRVVERRRMILLEIDRDRWFDFFLPIFEMTSRLVDEVLATRGNRLALLRITWIGAGGDRGPSEIEWLMILEVDETDAPALAITFDLDDLEPAYTELDARYLAGEAAPYART